MREKKLYNMNIQDGFFGRVVKSKEFEKAICPICNKGMVYEHNCLNIRFTCVNPKCKGYYRWLESYAKTFIGDIDLK